jgi:hypothetical protein
MSVSVRAIAANLCWFQTVTTIGVLLKIIAFSVTNSDVFDPHYRRTAPGQRGHLDETDGHAANTR